MASNQHPTYRMVYFDLGGVVVSFDEGKGLRNMAAATRVPLDRLAAAINGTDLLARFETGRVTPEAFHAALRDRHALDLPYAAFVGIWNDIFAVIPGTVSLIGELRGQVRVGVISNTNELHVAYLERLVPQLRRLEPLVLSCRVGARKPDPAIYAAATRAAGVLPHEVVYVDDRPDLVEAGRVFGFEAIRFDGAARLRARLAALKLLGSDPGSDPRSASRPEQTW